MLDRLSPRVRAALLALIAAVLGITGTVVLTDEGTTPPAKAPSATITTPVDGLDAGAAPDPGRVVEAPRAIVEQIAPRLEDDLNHPPPGTAPQQLEDVANAEQANRANLEALPTAGATAGFAGCRTSFVRNQSSRRGVRPVWQVLHYTVSSNVTGWADVNSVVALFDRSSSQASSHFVIDAEGHCAYIVPIESKSWTEAAANPFGISYEIIATGRESVYLPPAGLAKLKSVMREVSRRTGIPMRRGSNVGCTPGRSGIVQHKDFGTCGGGHVDISPFSVDAVVRAVSGPTCSRACDLRKRNRSTHRELRSRNCAPLARTRTRSARCRTLHHRHTALHKAARREGIKL